MKKVDLFFLLIGCLLSWTKLSAQTTDHALGELIVQLQPETDPQRWALNWSQFAGRPTSIRLQDRLSPSLNIHLFHFDHGNANELRLLSSIRRDPAVIAAQFNHFIDMRETTPDDPFFDRQWQYINLGIDGGVENADLDMDLAWDITTGGLTADGDSIVVCVIDDGLNIKHEDVAGNLWINHAEIPDNGLDDDLNGYVDDYYGWNVLQDNDELESGATHGTSVSGIIGAVGNNNIGVSGVNWNVKLMVIKNNNNTTEALVIKAYSYPLIQRIRYNETNGQEGAFVVATNTSWGLDNGFPEDAPIWCGLYDSLGVHGILNVGATANKNVDVDIDGDLPTTCTSDYLISVTNLDWNDEKIPNAGYGALSIDLGAHGQDVFTTTRTSYGLFNGTSSATPHVTGAIALLYSAPCPALMAVAKSDPAGAALLIRDYILNYTTPNASLEDITVTGGRLNVYNSLDALMDNCQDCQPPTSVNPRDITDVTASINWINNDSITQVDLRYRISGTQNWTEVTDVASPLQLNDLLACTDYEFQIKAYCGDEELEYSGSRTFKTDGCCEAPEPVLATNISGTSALMTWPSVLAADQYIFRWRESGAANWQEITTTLESVPLTGLSSCTNYDYQLLLNCSGDRTASSPVLSFNTLGCGVCRETDYCDPGAYDATGEWIARVKLGTLDNVSEGNSGYGDFTTLDPPFIEQSETYDILLKADFPDQSYSEYFLVWIDFNQDGVFVSEELVYDPGQTTKDSLIGQITIPENAKLGNTRMRVAMRFQQASTPCSQFGANVFGEVEDYCLEIIPATNCPLPSALDTISVTHDEAQLSWTAAEGISDYNVRYRPLDSNNWNTIPVSDTTVTLTSLEQCTSYEAQIQSDCGATQSIFLGNLPFDTDCLDAVNEPELIQQWKVFPNPVRERLTVSWDLAERRTNELQIQILSTSGQVLFQRMEAAVSGKQQTVIPTQDLPAGLYLVQLLDGQRVLAVEKVVKLR